MFVYLFIIFSWLFAVLAGESPARKKLRRKRRAETPPDGVRGAPYLLRRAAIKSASAPNAAANSAGSGTTVSVRFCPSHAKLCSIP